VNSRYKWPGSTYIAADLSGRSPLRIAGRRRRAKRVDRSPDELIEPEEEIMLELYHSINSVCAQKVRIALKEKGIEAKEHLMTLAGDQFDPAYIKLIPMPWCRR
jgi:hypothetical protein